MDVCNACFKEVKWNTEAPSFDCEQPNCVYEGCGANGGKGKFVHIGLDCGHFRWALTGLEREV